jgi:U3 small nucleolar RNA-associated protein 18
MPLNSIETNSEPMLEIDGGWQDSDDEIITVSLKSKNRLKKLRATEEEDIISGDQYEKRLRNQ